MPMFTISNIRLSMPPAGYSKTPLWKKLGYKEGFQIRLIDTPDNYSELLFGRPEGVVFDEISKIYRDKIEKSNASVSVDIFGQVADRPSHYN